MDKALVIVEGEVTESDLFDRVARLFDMDLQIHAVASNIYDLYQRLKEQDFAIDIRDVLDDMTADPDAKAMLHAELFPVYRFGNNRGLYDRISDVPRHPLLTVLIVCDAGGERDVETTLRSLRAQRMSRWNHRIVCRHDAQSLVLTGDVCEWVMFVRAGDVVQPGSLTSAKGLIELCPQARLCIYDACAQVRRLSDGRPDWGECVHVHRQALHPEKIRRLAPVPIMKTLHRRDLVDRSLDAWLLLSVGETLDRVGLGTGGALIEVASTDLVRTAGTSASA